MTDLHTNRTMLNKAIKFLGWALPMFFIGPAVIYNGFQNKGNLWHYLVLAVGIVVCFFAIFWTFKGLNTIMKGLFGR